MTTIKNKFIQKQKIKLINNRLISARTLFFNNLDKSKVKVIEDTDIAGISVADLLRNPSNKPYYNQRGSSAFANVVSRVLNNNNFEIAIKTVQTLNTTSYSQSTILRLKNVNSDFSQNYKDVIINGSKPVVMSGGIFSTLTTWEDNGKGLARELVNDGHDVWEIEMNGGDNTECSTCPDYTYQDQVDYFWPVLVAGVMNYSGKTQAHYIGHSNGCRVALSSLNSYSNGKNNAGYVFNSQTGLYDTLINLPNRPVDKFFGVACPATLNDDTTYTNAARQPYRAGPEGQIIYNTTGGYSMFRLTGNKHVSLKDYYKYFSVIGNFFDDEAKISYNLMNFYNNLALDTSSSFNINNVNVTKLYLLNTRPHDLVVGFDDQSRIFNSTNLNNEIGNSYNSSLIFYHSAIKDHNLVKKDLKGYLNER